MKNILSTLVILFLTNNAISQSFDFSKVSTKNTWLKVGLNAGVPLTPSNSYSFVLGLDANVQFLETKASGIGIKSGYSNYFSSNDLLKDMGEIPVALMYRYYPTSKGIFTGIDVGYSFLLNSPVSKGGFLGRPHIGYHAKNWNIFAYYNLIMLQEENLEDISSVGISITRNVYLKKK